MLSANLVAVIRKLYQFDRLPIKEIARRLNVSRNTVRKWIRDPDRPVEYPARSKSPACDFLEAHRDEVRAEFVKCAEKCPILRQRLRQRHRIDISLRTLERFCQPFRQSDDE